MPLGMIGTSLVYAFMFLLSTLCNKNVFIRAILLFLVTSFIHPFGFNWLDFRLLLLDSYFRPDLLSLFVFMLSIALFVRAKIKFKPLALLALAFCIDFYLGIKPPHLPFSFKLVNTMINQEDKWDKKLTQKQINDNAKLIDQAIKNKNRLIIFPESAFPIYLNRSVKVQEFLKKKSKKIAIITGALTYEDGKFYNSAYFFNDGEMKIFHKLILVPFGEEIPLPNFLKNIINDVFYDGAEDFSVAKEAQNYTVDGVVIRNAICFEATTKKLYENSPNIMIAISNNAWFTPSTQPLMQKLLLRLYSRLNNTTIYHSVNGSKSYIIYP